MYKIFLFINFLFFLSYFHSVYENDALAASSDSDSEKISIRAARHAEYVRIVFTLSEDKAKNISVSVTNEKLLKVIFHQPATLTSSRQGTEKVILKGEGFFEILKGLKIMAGTNFCLIQVERFDNYKLSRLNSPTRIVIDAYTLTDNLPPAPAKPSPQPFDTVVTKSFSSFVIDPGHGGYDKGIYDENTREKDINLNISKELARILAAGGKKTFLTRKADQRLSIRERTALSNTRSPDILISIHMSAKDEFIIYTDAPNEDSTSNAPKIKIAEDAAGNLTNALKKQFALNVRHERLPLPLLKQANAPALLIELPHFKNFSYDKKNNEALIKAIIKGILLTSPN